MKNDILWEAGERERERERWMIVYVCERVINKSFYCIVLHKKPQIMGIGKIFIKLYGSSGIASMKIT